MALDEQSSVPIALQEDAERPESPSICNSAPSSDGIATVQHTTNTGSENRDKVQGADDKETLQKEPSTQRAYLESLLNKSMKLKITDGRVLVGIFLCSDKDRNIILGSCQEHTKDPDVGGEEPRILGLAMVPGRHITAMYIDQS